MSAILSDVLQANAKYAAEFGSKAKLALPPARRFAILTCMDARLDPAKYDRFGGRRRSRDPQRGRTRE
jgi:carbonic anhydrase